MAQILRFNEWFQLAANYYFHHGNTEVNYNFKTFNGYDFDNNGYNLGIWVYTIRNMYKKQKLSINQLEKLKTINFRFENNYYATEWEHMYSLAVSYYNHYGNSRIYRSFKTFNGIDYNDNGYKLGEWMSTQRRFYRKRILSKDRYEKLNIIGFVDCHNGSISEKQNICKKFGIDYYKYAYLIECITYKELSSKIYYLLDNGYDVVDKNGKINRIFFMNSDTLNIYTGFTTKELIEYYSYSYMQNLIDEYYGIDGKNKLLTK